MPGFRRVSVIVVGCLLLAVMLMAGLSQSALAQSEAQAASGPPLNIALLVDSDQDRCYDRGYTAAIRRLAGLERDKINARGGIHGRPVELIILDGRRDAKQTIANVRSALETPHLLAMVGLTSSTRGKAVFSALGKEIGASGVPFISHISVSDIFQSHSNVYSTRPSQEAERVPAMAAFLAELGVGSVGFLGRSNAAYIDAIGDGLKESSIAGRLVADHRVPLESDDRRAPLDDAALDRAIADLKEKKAELLVLAVGTNPLFLCVFMCSAMILPTLKTLRKLSSVVLLCRSLSSNVRWIF